MAKKQNSRIEICYDLMMFHGTDNNGTNIFKSINNRPEYDRDDRSDNAYFNSKYEALLFLQKENEKGLLLDGHFFLEEMIFTYGD